MSKYDKEREAMGIAPVASSSSSRTPGKSKYDADREYYNNAETNNAIGNAYMDESRQVNESRITTPVEEPNSSKFRIPVLDYINDKVSNVGDLLNRAAITATDAIGLGQVKQRLDDGPSFVSDIFKDNAAPADTKAEKTADVVGSLYGFTAPAIGAYATGGKLAGNLLGRLAPNAPKVVNAITRGAGAGLAYGTAKEGLDAAVGDEDKSVSDRLKSVGKEAALFAAGDGALSVLGSGVKTIASKYAGTKLGDTLNRWMGIRQPQQEQILALPLGRGETRLNAARERGNLTPNNTPIANPHTFGLPEATPGTVNKVRNHVEANNALREIDTTIRQLDSGYQKAINDQFQLLKQQRNNRGGITQGNIIRDSSGEVIDRTGRISNNPQWYQEFYTSNGRMPSNKDLYSLAKQHVEDGYTDNGVQIPSWAKENDYHTTKEALASVKGEIQKTIGENSLNITPSKLKDDVLFAKNKPVVEAPQASKYTQEREQILKETAEPNPQPDDFIQSKEPRIRDKVVTLLDDAEKAARARIAARKGRLNSLPIDEWADHSIILAAQIGKGGIKLADATEYLVKEFGEQIRPHAVKILNQARNVAKETERRASKEAQEARAFNEGQTGDADSFSGKVSRDVKKDKTPFAQKLEKIRTQFVDDLAPLESLEKRVRGFISSAEDSLYKAGRMFRGVPEKANQIVKERLSPIIDGIEKQGYTTKELGDYALAVHAKDVNARDIKSGFTNKEIENVIQKYGTPEMEAARKELVKVGDDMLQELADTGVISGDLMKSLRERYPNYIPLFRSFDDKSVNFAGGLSNALANVTAPIKGLKGSERAVVDPFENMVKNIFQSTNAAERNKVAQQLSKLSKDDPEGNFIRKLDEHEDVGRKNVVSVLENGNKVRYEVEPEVYKAMLNLDKESSNMLIKVLQKPASLLRAGATLTPEFSLRNPLRDVAQAFVTSKSGFNPIIDFPVGLIQSISKGDLYKSWVKELGAYGNIISNDRQVHKEALERVLKEPASKKFVNIVTGKSLIKMLRAISDTTESATKVGEFRAALRQGQTPQEAAYRSRDLMDFGRSGSSIRETNKVVAFLNANIQGKSKLIRSFKENPAGVSARAFTAVTVPTIGVFLMQKYMANDSQKLTIDESPQWQKDTFWLLPVPGTDQVARIPKPFDLNVLFSNLPERAMNYIWNNDKEAMDGFAKKSIADSALPGMISGILPFVEGMANYSFFAQSSIIPRAEEGRNYSDQYSINTTETAKLLAKGAEKLTGGQGSLKNFSSPRIMDNTIRGLTAGLGQYATSAIDVLVDKIGLTDNPSRPAKGPAQQPLAKAFLVNPTQSGKSTEKLYNLKDQLTREKGSAKFNEKPLVDDGKLGFITEQTDAMSSITKNIRAIENDRTLTPQKKRDLIEPLLKERNKIAQQSMKRLGQK